MKLITPEGAEQEQAEVLQRIFEGKTDVEGVQVSKYIDVDLSLLTYLPDGGEKRETIKFEGTVKCGKCGEKHEVVSIIKQLPSADATQFFDLAATIVFHLKWDNIVKDVETGKIDKYNALKRFRTLNIMLEKRKEHLRDNVTIHTPIACSKCWQEIGLLDGRFSLNSRVPECKEITQAMTDILPNPPPEILARISKRIGIHPANFDAWIKCAWFEQLKQKVQGWKNDLKILNIPEDLNYQIDSFFSEIITYAEDETKKRKGKFTEALDYVIDEDLHELRA